ncbi:hypothetical protein NKG05_27885 [Oerskovia sp. M15]
MRWDPAGFADRELAERRELDLPRGAGRCDHGRPAGRGRGRGPRRARGRLHDPGARGGRRGRRSGRTRAGPFAAAPVRTIVRVPLRQGRLLARELSASLAVRSAKREGGSVRVQLDPKEML